MAIVAVEHDNEVLSPPDDRCTLQDSKEPNPVIPVGFECASESPQSSSAEGSGKISKDIPKWPDNLSSKFSPISRLGIGAFGAVWKASRRGGPHGNGDVSKFVAIKSINTSTDNAKSYAQREITILNELSPHPNIVTYFETFRYTALYFVVLSLVEGPTLFSLVKKGGALSFDLGNIVCCHMIQAVSHLHKHAVLHRDIKPDNCIVTGVTANDTRCWDDDCKEESKKVWNPKLVLVDFGFARALSPSEINDDIGLKKLISERILNDSYAEKSKAVQKEDPSMVDVNIINSALSERVSTEFGESTYFKKKEKRGLIRVGSARSLSKSLDYSLSRRTVLDLSAIGSKKYAAPEILNGVRNKPSNEQKSLAPCVSNYGMVVDAYSVGAVIREVYTGVPPTENISTHIFNYNSILKKCIRKLRKRGEKKFRTLKDIPVPLAELIKGLISWNQLERMTTHTALHHPWVQSFLDKDAAAAHYKRMQSTLRQDIYYLPSALTSN